MQWLIWGLEFLVALPGSTFAVGRISLAVLLLCYGLLVLVWLSDRWRRRWQWLGLTAIVAIILPVTYRHFTLIQVSVLASPPEQIVVIQERGQVALINSGEPNTVRYTLLPFLQRQGINRIQTAISLADNSLPGWQALLTTVPIDRLYSSSALGEEQLAQEQLGQEPLTLKANDLLTVDSSKIKLIDGQSGLLRIEISGQTWWLLSSDSVNEFPGLHPSPQFLIWPGQPLEDIAEQGLAAAIATGIIPETEGKVFATAREGAMQWTPERGLTLTAELQE
ncbi:MAG: hypothetical protein HC890_11715 [Chloroflexaceae bacterium]|nr:hypothetical protein [Chloroflexaceae bacterium]